MTETLRDKLIRCGWVTNFNADTLVQLIERHYAALSQPEPQGPTDEELDEMGNEYWWLDANHSKPWRPFARAVLARWGRPIIEPVPVAERLPGPEDCDAEGRCWMWGAPLSGWIYRDSESFHLGISHWLPHHALPVPQQEAD